MREDLRTSFITRQYMVSNDFEIYYYSDLHASSGESHTHDYYEFYFFIGGDVSMVIGNNTIKLKSGDLILIPPKLPHNIIIHDPDKYYQRFVFWVTCDYCNRLIASSSAYGFVMQRALVNKQYVYHYESIAFNSLQSKIFELIQETQQNRFGSYTRINILLADLIFSINRSAYEADHPIEIKEEAGLYQNLIIYIDAHITDSLSLEDIASKFYVSKYHISHLFKDNLGISIHRYILKKRLSLFRDYIRENNEINEAYLACGFSDYSSFYRAFKKEYGISPSEYREQILKQAIELATSKTSITNNTDASETDISD